MASRHWVGDSGNWSDNTNHWSASSGGAPGASKPTSADNVYFDANSFSGAGQTVTVDEVSSCLDMDWTGATNSPTLAGSFELVTYGNITLISAMVFSFTGPLQLRGQLTTAGHTLSVAYIYVAGAASLGDDLTSTRIALAAGSLLTNNHNITLTNVLDTIDANPITLTLGSSIITCAGWDLATGGGVNTVVSNTATINITGTGNLTGGNINYNGATFVLQGTAHTVSGGFTGAYLVCEGASSQVTTLQNNNTFTRITMDRSVAAKTLKLTSGSTQTVTDFRAPGALALTINTTTPGTIATLTKSAKLPGIAVATATITDIVASPASTWFYHPDCTVSASSTGWSACTVDVGLVLHLPLNEGTGTTAKDRSGMSNDGTLTNGPEWVDGKFGKCVQFDGSNDYINVADHSSLDILTDITLEAWVRVSSVAASDLIEKGGNDGYVLLIGGSYVFKFVKQADGSSEAAGTTVVSADTWYHVICIKDNSTGKIYVNGVLEGTDTSFADFGNVGALTIGKGGDGYLNGLLAGVRIYNRALTTAEIAELYALGAPGDFPGKSFSFIGQDLSESRFNLVVSKKRPFDFGADFSERTIPGRDGQYSGRSQIKPRVITIRGQVMGSSESDLEDKLDNIKKALFTRTPEHLILANDTSKQFLAKLRGFDIPDTPCGNTTADLNLDFVCDDPAAYDVDITEAVNEVIAATTEYEIETDGTLETYPVITLTANGSITADIVIAAENGTLTYAGDMTNGQVLIIDSKYQTLTKAGTSDMANTSGIFPILQAGYNRITITGFTGTVLIEYYNRWL